jgi:hypothetical protein
MRSFTARSLALATLVPALLLLVLVPGCAKQSEGERCGDNTYGPDSDDCDDGLICKQKEELLHNETHRCCYSNTHVSDERCEPKGQGAPSVAGSGSGGGGGAEAIGAGGEGS